MKKNNLKLILLSTFITVFFCELVLRITGTKPGTINTFDGFVKVDSLIVCKNFITDDSGIYKFGPWITDSLLKYFDCEKREIVSQVVKDAIYESDRILYLYETFCKQTTKPRFSFSWTIREIVGQEVDSNFVLQTHLNIVRNKLALDTVWVKAFEEYFVRPFNQDGFRGISFKNHSTKQLKVLIIGDSFVYGIDARPLQNSFTDILLSRGYLVYNAGLPGTDPAQYAAIAKKYIPIIKPDVVVSCFFSGNDYMKYTREPDAKRPIEHITNAGLLASTSFGKYLSPNEAYQYYLSLTVFPDSSQRCFDNICSYSAIGTVLWNTLYNKNLITHVSKKYFEQERLVPKDSINARTKIYTDRLSFICMTDNVPLIQAVIPDQNFSQLDTLSLKYLFGNNYFAPKNIFNSTDRYNGYGHFNNAGALKYANFLDTILHPFAQEKASKE